MSTAVAAPTTRRTRRVAAWVAIALAVLVIGGIGAAISQSGRWELHEALDPESSGPTGTRALAEVLRDHGLEVRIVRDRGAAAAALAEGPSTLVLPDTPALSDEGLAAATARATDIVLIDPRARTLDALLDGARPAGVAPDEPVPPDCDLADATRSGPVAPRAIYAPPGTGDVSACYPVGDSFGLLVLESSEGGRVAAVDGAALFTNEHLAENGNAALAANLMGRHPLVVWYHPALGDTDLSDTSPTLGDLTPPWVSPVIVLLLVAGITAGIWRGRRFGPLVAERLPVTVRASETTEGRARLYAQSRDAVHAADQLRIGALDRLARLLGLGLSASAVDISDAAASRAGFDHAAVRRALLDDLPSGDADLVALSLQLRQLEDAVHAAVRPERKPR